LSNLQELKMADGKVDLTAIDQFNKSNLKQTKTDEKVVLPSPTDIVQEKTEAQLMDEITHGTKLKPVSTEVKNPLPTAEEIEAEKKACGKK